MTGKLFVPKTGVVIPRHGAARGDVPAAGERLTAENANYYRRCVARGEGTIVDAPAAKGGQS
jgi:hypothetical protein